MRRDKVESSRRRRWLITLEVLVVLGIVFGVIWFALRPGEEDKRRRDAARAAEAYAAGEYEDAMFRYRDLVERSPGNIALRRDLCACFLRLNRLGEAEEQALEMVELDGEFAPAHLALAEIAKREGDLSRAVKEALLATQGKNVARGARVFLAEVLLEDGRVTQGVKVLSEAVQGGEGGEAAAIRLAMLMPGGGRRREVYVRAAQAVRAAREREREVLAEDPTNPDALRSFAALSLGLGEAQAAAEALESAALRRPLVVRESLLLVRALAGSGRMEEARALMDTLEATLSEDDRDVGPGDLAQTWLDLREPQKALDLVEPAVADALRDVPLLRLRLEARWLLARISPEQVDPLALATMLETAADAVLDLRPADETALAARGASLLTQGRIVECLAAALTLRGSAPRSPAGGWLHGLALLGAGYHESALSVLLAHRAGARDQAARWIVRAALGAGDAETAGREARTLEGAGRQALRVAVAAVAGDLDRAERLLRSPEFASAPLDEKLLAAGVLGRANRRDLSREIAGGVEAKDLSGSLLVMLGDLYRMIGDREDAGKVYTRASLEPGPGALAALLRLVEIRLASDAATPGRIEDLLDRMRTLPGGEIAARISEARAALARDDPRAAEAAAREVLAVFPESPGALSLLLAALGRQGPSRWAETVEAGRRLLEVAPGHRGARIVRARALYETAKTDLVEGRILQAGEQLTEAVDLVPGASVALLLRGVLRAASGDLEAAEADARLLAESAGGEGAGRYLIGILRLRQGRVEEAIEALKASVEAEPESPASLGALAIALLAGSRPEEALEVAEQYALLVSEDTWSLKLKAVAVADAGRTEDAVALLRSEVTEDDRGQDLRALVGWILLRGERATEAAEEYEALVRERPEVFQGYSLLVDSYLAAGQPDRAMAVAEKAVAHESAGAGAHLLRARVRAAAEDPEGELADLEQAEVLAPDAPPVLLRLGTAYLKRQRTEEGRRRLERAAELLPADSRVRVLLGMLASRVGRAGEAIELYEQALRLEPGNPVAANNLAYHLLKRPGADPDRIVNLARAAAKALPDSASAHDTLAVALSATGNSEGAVAATERAMQLAPRNCDYALNAARILKAAGLVEKASAAARKADALAPEERKTEVWATLRRLGLLEEDD